MTTFTEDQIEKIRETLGDEAVAKLTPPKVYVPKWVSGEWLAEHAIPGVKVLDEDGYDTTLGWDEGWAGNGRNPITYTHKLYTIITWPNGGICENTFDPPEQIVPLKVADGSGELKVGDAITSVEQLDSLPTGSVVAYEHSFPWAKSSHDEWIHCWTKESSSSRTVFSLFSGYAPILLRVGWAS